jgi:hypothetical protein
MLYMVILVIELGQHLKTLVIDGGIIITGDVVATAHRYYSGSTGEW